MSAKLFFKAIFRFLLGLVLIGALLFLPAWTLNYWNAWVLIGLLFLPMVAIGIVMMFRSPELLEKRLNAKEKEKGQMTLIWLSGVMFIAAFVMAGLNFRFSWIILPNWVIYFASGVFLLAYIMFAEVMRENAYLSRTVEVQENQKVVATGLYGIIRHPMYCATLIMFICSGLILGSLISFAILLCYIPIIVLRIINEEKILIDGLEGYREYTNKVKYRLIPFIW